MWPPAGVVFFQQEHQKKRHEREYSKIISMAHEHVFNPYISVVPGLRRLSGMSRSRRFVATSELPAIVRRAHTGIGTDITAHARSSKQ